MTFDSLIYFISGLFSLGVALIAVYFDRYLTDKRERKQLLNALYSEVKRNLVVAAEIFAWLGISRELIEKGKMLTVSHAKFLETVFTFVDSRGLSLLINEDNYNQIVLVYLVMSRTNRNIDRFETLRWMPVSRKKMVLASLIEAIEKSLPYIEKELQEVAQFLENFKT